MTAYNSRNTSTEVILNVYDLAQSSFQTSLLKSGGIGFYHSGIEIDGIEYSYGGNFEHSGTGVFSQEPLVVEGVVYKESFLLGTLKDKTKLQEVLAQVSNEFKAN
jgi:hypothetical protein